MVIQAGSAPAPVPTSQRMPALEGTQPAPQTISLGSLDRSDIRKWVNGMSSRTKGLMRSSPSHPGPNSYVTVPKKGGEEDEES